MDDNSGRRIFGARPVLAGVLLLLFGLTLAAALWPGHSARAPSTVAVALAAPSAEQVTVRMRVVRLGGGSEDFDLMSSGRVVHRTDWDSRELALPPGIVQRLEHELLACGICALEPVVPIPAGPSRRRIHVEVLTQPNTCSANLPWEKWFEDQAARNCLEAIGTALQPLIKQCGECTVPRVHDSPLEKP